MTFTRLPLTTKVILAVIVLGLLALVAGLTYQRLQAGTAENINTDHLSARAEEFIATQKQIDSNPWTLTHLETPDPNSSEIVKVTTQRFSTQCFSLSLGFEATEIKVNSDSAGCTLSARLTAPAARLVVWQRAQNLLLDEDSGVALRRNQKNIFSESTLKVPQFKEVSVFTSDDQIAIFAQSGAKLVSFALTETNADRFSQSDLLNLLNSYTMTSPPQK